MEGCKERAREAGLQFENESLEYIVTNRDLLELSPKVMIPTMYDYWVQDVEILREKGRYEIYPHNPYETVINTRPAISFYNDNNPDWLNVMIFYHVLGHIDFFQNNTFFSNTWGYDFNARALADKRLISRLRSEHGRWVDYIIEFARGIDNIVGYHNQLQQDNHKSNEHISVLDYYFDVFLQQIKKVSVTQYLKEVEVYNAVVKQDPENSLQKFHEHIIAKHPEFDSLLQKFKKNTPKPSADILQFLLEYSPFLKKEKNSWMRSVLEVVRSTSLYFQPQIRTKIMNEGWASYWHEKLFLQDERIKGHEVDFARAHAQVTSVPKVGLNPYAIGLRLFYHIEQWAEQGKFSFEFDRINDAHLRRQFNQNQFNQGQQAIFEVRRQLCDSLFIQRYVNQDFVDTYKLFVTGKKLDPNRMVWQYYVKSKRAEEYRKMLLGSLYHPPYIRIESYDTAQNSLHLVHQFEGLGLVKEYIGPVMMGIEYLWGGPVELKTHEPIAQQSSTHRNAEREQKPPDIHWREVTYVMKNKKLSKS